jgi:hypothetical protein
VVALHFRDCIQDLHTEHAVGLLGDLLPLCVVSATFRRRDRSLDKELISWMAPTTPTERLQWESSHHLQMEGNHD